MREERLPFGNLQYFEDYVISTIDGGIDLDRSCVDTLIDHLNQFYGNRPFAYITHRVNDYSLNPAEAKRLITETQIRMAAFVLLRKFSYDSYQTERAFYKIPTAAFGTMEEAINWVKKQLTEVA